MKLRMCVRVSVYVSTLGDLLQRAWPDGGRGPKPLGRLLASRVTAPGAGETGNRDGRWVTVARGAHVGRMGVHVRARAAERRA